MLILLPIFCNDEDPVYGMQALYTASGGVLHLQWNRAQHHSIPERRAKGTQELQLLYPLWGAAVLWSRQPR